MWFLPEKKKKYYKLLNFQFKHHNEMQQISMLSLFKGTKLLFL